MGKRKWARRGDGKGGERIRGAGRKVRGRGWKGKGKGRKVEGRGGGEKNGEGKEQRGENFWCVSLVLYNFLCPDIDNFAFLGFRIETV